MRAQTEYTSCNNVRPLADMSVGLNGMMLCIIECLDADLFTGVYAEPAYVYANKNKNVLLVIQMKHLYLFS